MNPHGWRTSLFVSARVQLYLAVAVKETEAPPSATWSCAVTVTVPGDEGSVRVTEATPEELVSAITLVPLVVPLKSVPADVVNRMPAPVADPPDRPGESVTVKGCANAVPATPD
jgi:hypothetical protein